VREAVAGEDRTDPDNPRSPVFVQVFELADEPAKVQLVLRETKTRRGARGVVLSNGDATELSTPAAVDEAGAVEFVLDQLAGWARRHYSESGRSRLSIAEAGVSGAIGKIREAVAGQGRIDPDDPESPTFSQAFEATAQPADAQLVLTETEPRRGVRILVLSRILRDETRAEMLFRTSVDEAGAVSLALGRLTSWARWLNLLGVDNPHAGLEVEFEIRPAAGAGRDVDLPSKPDLVLKAGQEVEFEVTNKSDRDAYFAILDLASDGSIEVVYPGEGRNEALAPGKSYKDSAPTSVPEGRKASRDYLKLVVTQAPVDFRFLRQDAIKGLPRDGRDPLSDLLDQAALNTKQVGVIRAKLDGWATKVKVLDVDGRP
jgi:hypothetical protein